MRREVGAFVAVGATVAVSGRVMLTSLIAAGIVAALANAIQLVATLQLNFLGNRLLTWRRRAAYGAWSRQWLRFHVARGGSALLSVCVFPALAPVVGTAAAYWGLLAAGTVVNFCSDRFWSFAGGRGRSRAEPRAHGSPEAASAPGGPGGAARSEPTRPRWWRGTHRRPRALPARLAPTVVVLVVLGILAAVYADAALVAVSVFMIVVAVSTLAFQMYKWWRPENNDPNRYGDPDAPRLPGVILVPMRHEEAVAGHTLERLANLNHPDYRVVAIIDHPDDPGTARIAHAAAARYPDKVLVAPYPEDTHVHNKPIGLNAAVAMLAERGIVFEWVGIADAEDLFHPDLLRMVDYRFRHTGAGIVQCGVQLMNFSAHPGTHPLPQGVRLPRMRRWWRAWASGWWRAANVLEYYKWFQSRLKLQAATKVVPLGGNTVFFRRGFLDALRQRYGAYWDESCLTEDCKIGIAASVLGYRVDVVYIDHMVTREETPHNLRAFLGQRVRWMQGFMQVFAERDWLALPRLHQRILAVYALGFQFFQAFAMLMAPVAVALALWFRTPVEIALLATLPLGISVVNIGVDVLLLAQFGRTFDVKVRLRDHLGVILGAYPYQMVLSVAAMRAWLRQLTGRGDWVKTAHHGVHLDLPAPVPGAARPVAVGG
jgi:cellulose synthase/poly-beta-1,6-N-acetylglucosamine synthase-like glycosyltransferase/putative flippase GtrA